LADILGALGDAFLSIMEALGPVINMLISVLVPVLKTVADVIKSVGDFVAKVIYFIQRLVWTMVQWMDDFVHNWKQRLTPGLAEGEMRTRTVSDIWDQSGKWLEEQKKRIQMDSHRTPGPRSVDIITNIEQISARAQEAAGKIDAARQTADNTKQMVGSLSWIGRMVEEVARRHGMDLDGVAAQQAQDRAGRGHAFAERVFDRNIADQLRAQGLIR
jgi:murein L,D-transpeptidase YafK